MRTHPLHKFIVAVLYLVVAGAKNYAKRPRASDCSL